MHIFLHASIVLFFSWTAITLWRFSKLSLARAQGQKYGTPSVDRTQKSLVIILARQGCQPLGHLPLMWLKMYFFLIHCVRRNCRVKTKTMSSSLFWAWEMTTLYHFLYFVVLNWDICLFYYPFHSLFYHSFKKAHQVDHLLFSSVSRYILRVSNFPNILPHYMPMKIQLSLFVSMYMWPICIHLVLKTSSLLAYSIAVSQIYFELQHMISCEDETVTITFGSPKRNLLIIQSNTSLILKKFLHRLIYIYFLRGFWIQS